MNLIDKIALCVVITAIIIFLFIIRYPIRTIIARNKLKKAEDNICKYIKIEVLKYLKTFRYQEGVIEILVEAIRRHNREYNKEQTKQKLDDIICDYCIEFIKNENLQKIIDLNRNI